MFKKKLYQIVLLALIFVSCQQVKIVKSKLTEAETFLETVPDSALVVLEGIDSKSLKTKKLKAEFALLYSMALDKNYIDVADDSLVRIAVNYYDTRDDEDSKMKSYYYLGRVQFNAGNYAGALISFDTAEQHALPEENYFYAGLIYRAKADIYNAVYNHHEELECAQKAYEYFEKSGIERFHDFAILELGIASNNNEEYEKAKALYLRAMDIATAKKDTVLLASAVVCYASLLSYDTISNPTQIINLYKQAKYNLNWDLSTDEYVKLSEAYATLHQKDSSELYLNSAKQVAYEVSDSIRIWAVEYQINKLRKNYKSALEFLEKTTEAQDSLLTIMLNQSVVASQRDYFRTISSKIESERQAQNRLYIVLVLILLLIIVSIISGFLQFRSKQKRIMSEYINNADVVSKRLYAASAEKQEMADSINDLLKDKFATIDSMIIEYYEKGDNSQKHIYEKIREQIDALKSDTKMMRNLETILNKYNNGIMELVRNEIPSLRPDELRFLCYIYLGFSSQALCVFMNESSIDNIYRKKSRLKSKINSSDALHKELFVVNFK